MVGTSHPSHDSHLYVIQTSQKWLMLQSGLTKFFNKCLMAENEKEFF